MKCDTGGRLFPTGLASVFLFGAGCVSTSLQPASDHPARSDAPSGRVETTTGDVLRSGAPLYPSGATYGSRMAGSAKTASGPEGTREAPYVGQGIVRGVGEAELRIQHGPIPGFMGAMTMPFSIAPEAMEESLELGDEIIFEIEHHPEHGYQIFNIDLVDPESAESFDSEFDGYQDPAGSPGPPLESEIED